MISILHDPLFTITQLCSYLGLERHTVAKMFRDETGVIVLRSKPKRKTINGQLRGYRVVRIPQSVVNRVLARREGK
jgi:hypothetical protein